ASQGGGFGGAAGGARLLGAQQALLLLVARAQQTARHPLMQGREPAHHRAEGQQEHQPDGELQEHIRRERVLLRHAQQRAEAVARGKVTMASRKLTSTHSESSHFWGSVSGVSRRRIRPAPDGARTGSGAGSSVPRTARCSARSAPAKPWATCTPATRIGRPTQTTTEETPAASSPMRSEKPTAPSSRATNP